MGPEGVLWMCAECLESIKLGRLCGQLVLLLVHNIM